LILLGRRLLEGLLTAWAAVSVTFFALRLSAGDPVASLLARGLATQDQVQALRVELGLAEPLLIQYLRFLSGLLRGDLGRSLYTYRPVHQIIAEQLPFTLQLALSAFSIALVLSTLLGITAAWWGAQRLGRGARLIAGLATALPVAFTGILALLAYRSLLRSPSPLALQGIQRTLLPALVLGFSSSGAMARVIQTGLETSMRAPYMLAAKARGISSPIRLLWHALKPSLPPAVSLSALEAAFLFGGTVVTETVFSRPGLGRLLVGSILQGDFPIAQGLVALAALFYTASHIVADAIVLLIDPRIRRPT
jgi:peptide/nickel transport system permease protein